MSCLEPDWEWEEAATLITGVSLQELSIVVPQPRLGWFPGEPVPGITKAGMGIWVPEV